MSISVRVDEGIIAHNNRAFVPKNVDKNRIKDNITYKQEDIKKVYEELFGEALKEYNDKQTRSDRKISNYYEHILNGNQEKTFYEAIIQFGDKDNAGINTDGGELAKKMLDEYMKGFIERNPNLRVFNAVMHLDEATPHLHISFIPFAENQKRGLSTRVSLKKAYESQGISAKGKKETERQQWAKKEKEVMSAIAKKFGLDIENKKISRPHLTVDEYKEEKIKLDEIKKQTEQLLKKTGGKKADELSQEDLDLIRNENEILKSEVLKREQKIKTMEEKLSSKMIYFHVTNDEKLQFMLDKLSEKNISCVEDIKGFHAPAWAENIVNEQFRFFKPSQPTARDKIKLDIDRLIYCSKDLPDLISKLEQAGYQIRRGKYISIKAPDSQRSIRTKSLGDEYTEENLKRRIDNKSRYMNKAEEKIQATAGIQREYMLQVKQTIILIYKGQKYPRKRNYNRPYTIENDYHINELAGQLQLINRDRISSGADLENRFEALKNKIAEKQLQLRKTEAIRTELKEILGKAQFYFSNKDKVLDSMGQAKLAAAKETLDEFGVDSTDEANRVLGRFRDCERLIASLKDELPALHHQQNEYVSLMQTYAHIQEGSYIDRLVAEEIKRQEKSL